MLSTTKSLLIFTHSSRDLNSSRRRIEFMIVEIWLWTALEVRVEGRNVAGV